MGTGLVLRCHGIKDPRLLLGYYYIEPIIITNVSEWPFNTITSTTGNVTGTNGIIRKLYTLRQNWSATLRKLR